jgi:hypothetical protein
MFDPISDYQLIELINLLFNLKFVEFIVRFSLNSHFNR